MQETGYTLPPNYGANIGGTKAEKLSRPMTEVEGEVTEAHSISMQFQDVVKRLESRLASVLSRFPEKPEQNEPQSLLTPLANDLRGINEINRQTIRKINTIIDGLQVPYSD